MSNWPVSTLLLRSLVLPVLVLLSIGCIHDELTHRDDARAHDGTLAVHDPALAMRIRVLSGELGIAVRLCDAAPHAENWAHVGETVIRLQSAYEEALSKVEGKNADATRATRLHEARAALLQYYAAAERCTKDQGEAGGARTTKALALEQRREAYLEYMALVESLNERPRASCLTP